MKSIANVWFKRLFQVRKQGRSGACDPVWRKQIWPIGFELLENRVMLSAVKWSPADFELINAESPEGEPWLAATADGRFNLTFFESFAGPPAYTDIETRVYSAAGNDTGTGPAPTFSPTTIDHQGTVAYFPDNRSVYTWTEEPTAGGGNLEDVYASVYVANLVSVPRFFVAGGAGIQHDPVVAASTSGFVIALADDSVATGQLILKFYNAVGGLINTVSDADGVEGVNTQGGTEDDYRDVEITALANGNYVVVWTDDIQFDIWARIYSSNGVAQTGLIEIEPGGAAATFPDVTALADGRFLVTYGQYSANTVRGRIYEANGAPSTGPFTIGTTLANGLNQQVQSAALNDGRFVTVWRNVAGNIEGQVMFTNGTADGTAFAVNGDGAGGKGRPTVATLADGRFAVSWESGAGAAQTIFSTIFDARDTGLKTSASSFNDDWYGTNFADQIYGGTGTDVIRGAGGADRLFGESGNDTLDGNDGNDRLYGGNNNDILNGAAGNDTLFGQLGDDILNADVGDDALHGDAGDDTLRGGNGVDSLWGGNGTDVFQFLDVGESGLLALRDKIVDFNQLQLDLIDVSSIDGKTSDPASSTFTFIGNSAFNAEGQIRAIQVGTTAVVEFNTTGNGGAEMQIALVNFTAANLTINDFVVAPLFLGWYGGSDGSSGWSSNGFGIGFMSAGLDQSISGLATPQFQSLATRAGAYSLDVKPELTLRVHNSNRSTDSPTQLDLVILDSVFADFPT